MYNFKKIEKKWQKKWEESNIFKVVEDKKKKKFYCLEMFPYPSASGLHMGHAFNYTIGDAYSRFKRMNGFNVIYPMGYDSFGLPAENAAIKAKIHPKKFTEKSISNFIKQQKALGLSYDWSRMVSTCNPDYYKWNQLFFLKFMEKNLVNRKKAPVNWCPKCNTVLANEQVHDGKCWRHKNTEVEEKYLEQWFIKTTAYADELYDMIPDLEWPERIKIMQKNWINKSYGLTEIWDVEGTDKKIETFTTWPHTTLGCTFVVMAPEHPLIKEWVAGTKYEKEVLNFIKKIKSESMIDRLSEGNEKEGVFFGKYAINYATGRKMPIYVANFAIMEYGSGIVKCCPAHDQRDFEFAKKYDIEIIPVITPKKGKELKVEEMTECYHDEGIMINAKQFTGMDSLKAREEFSKWAIKERRARKDKQFKLRDWLISRQRYWGTPIPVIHCEKCGAVPVPEKDLPVRLPEKVKFGKGNPLVTNKSFVNTKCPKCKSKAKRETDTMDTFFDSSWYFLRYC
ncbi:leucine--tRNA ligase, partial [Candidatus Woesearchaeota archaeon]|nr:leucine--tRNA ligase [Candidatus Woesearchaeota archaeon]